VRIGWRLGATLMLFAATAIVLHLAPPVKGAVNPVSLDALPTRLGPWSGAEGVPEDALPPDPNEKVSVRRTYRNGHQVAWVSVALFTAQDGEARRASINKMYPQRNVSLIEPVSIAVPLNGPAVSPITLPGVIVHQDSRQLLVVYWHQIGRQAYGNEYRFRLALMRDMIFARRADTLLVRIALPAAPDRPVRAGLETASELAVPLYAAIAQEIPQ
jgi:EpsI family protein